MDEDPFAVRLPTLVVATKTDQIPGVNEELAAFRELTGFGYPAIVVSVVSGDGLDQIGPFLFQRLDVVRVYTKVLGRPPDLTRPFTVRRDQTGARRCRARPQGACRRASLRPLWRDGSKDGRSAGTTPWRTATSSSSTADATLEANPRLTQLNRSPVVTDLARAHPVFGERLRRQKWQTDARHELQRTTDAPWPPATVSKTAPSSIATSSSSASPTAPSVALRGWAPRLDESGDSRPNTPLAFPAGVLIDPRCSRARVPSRCHQLPKACPLGRQRVPGVFGRGGTAHSCRPFSTSRHVA